jgi:hypothetical protein
MRYNLLPISALALIALLQVLLADRAVAGEATTLRVYHVGNSLTLGLRLDRLRRLFLARGIDEQFGSQLSGGKTLQDHMNYAKAPDKKWVSWETNVATPGGWEPGVNFYLDANPKRFGLHDQALPQHTWDVVVLQPHPSATMAEDVQACVHFINMALTKSPQARFFIYATWPQRLKGTMPKGMPIDFQKVWLGTYPGGVESTEKYRPCRDYFEKLRAQVSAQMPTLAQPVALVPGGEVLFELDRAIRAGQLPGLAELQRRVPALVPGWGEGSGPGDGINLLYADIIHLNPIPHDKPTLGGYAVALAMFSVLSGQSPVGLPGSYYDLDDTQDAALIAAVQELVWKVVKARPSAAP